MNPLPPQSKVNLKIMILFIFEILDDGGDEEAQEKCKKSNLFEIHIKNVEKSDGTKIIICNYCSKELKWSKSGNYSTYRRHINSLHPTKARR